MIFANRAAGILYWFLKAYPEGTYILPANICPVVPLTFRKAGVEFEFLDINPGNLCLDGQSVIDAIFASPNKYRGMVFVRTYGYLADMSDVFSQIKDIAPGFLIVDDRCLCFPDFSSQAEHTDLELYSTGYAKPIDLGYGGFAKTCHDIQFGQSIDFRPDSYKELEKIYKQCLNERKPMHSYPQDWLDADIGNFKNVEYIRQIEESIIPMAEHKQRLNNYYSEHLPSDITLEEEFQNWRFNILTDNKLEILDAIFSKGLYASSHYASSSILFNKGEFPVTEQVSDRIINLFNDYNYTLEQAKATCGVICETLGQA